MSLYSSSTEVQEKVQAGDPLATPTVLTLTVTGVTIIASGLPTSDPSVAGMVYNSSGTLKLSAG